jgi:NitT/TauT family transport system substrate-binding protein
MAEYISRSRMLAASAAAFTLAPRPTRAQQLTKVRLVGVQADDLTPVYWALRNGMYQKVGLDLELVAASSGTAATAAVVAGAYEMGKGSAIASLVAHLRGLPITIIGNGVVWDTKAPNTVAVVAPDSPITRPRDLTGKTCSAAALNDIVTMTMSNWVDKDGGDSKTMKWVEIPNSAEAEAIAGHRVDACQLNEPLYTAAIEAGKVRTLGDGRSSNSIGDHFVIAVFFANKEFAEKNPELVRNFARVTYQSAAYTNAHPAETAQLMSEVTKIDLAVMKKIYRAPGATTGAPALLQPVIDVAAKYGNISRAFAAKEAYFRAT